MRRGLPPPAVLRALVSRNPHRAGIYWTDLFATAVLAWSCVVLATMERHNPAFLVLFVLAGGLAQLRAVYFVHEIVHFPPGVLPGFRWAWFLVAGMPSFVPRFMVDPHVQHHRPSTYGTKDDPEYADVPRWGRLRLVGEALVLALAPPLLFVRFAIVAPVSWCVPPLRRTVVCRMSALATQPGYSRRYPSSGRARASIVREELACAFFGWTLILATIGGAVPVRSLFVWWATSATALVVNMVRTFVAHGYEGAPSRADLEGQCRDTLSLEGHWLTELAAPLGTRFHALHHLLPSLPYHALGRVHRDLCVAHGDLDAIQRGRRDGIADALGRLWRLAGRPLPSTSGASVLEVQRGANDARRLNESRLPCDLESVRAASRLDHLREHASQSPRSN